MIVGLLLTVTRPDSANGVRTTSPTTGVGVQNIATNRSAGDPTDNDPRAQIVKLTGAWSVQGFVDAIEQRNTDIVDKYLKSGMKATTLHSNASAILYGFQGDMDNDPVALLKTFQGNGYKLDDELVDGRILHSISDSLPLRFETPAHAQELHRRLLGWRVRRPTSVVGRQPRIMGWSEWSGSARSSRT